MNDYLRIRVVLKVPTLPDLLQGKTRRERHLLIAGLICLAGSLAGFAWLIFWS